MYKRECLECGKSILYKSEASFKKANRNKTLCKSCCCLGNRNSFYGKRHTMKTKNKLSQASSSQIHTEESKRKRSIKMSGSKNSMYGKSLYDHWENKYGVEKAKEKYISMVSKQSENAKGKNNPMYGKPSPQGSGNGWSGWYKGWYFRSLRELSYVINYLEENNLEWISAEKKKFSIPYKNYDGTDRTYRPDFFVENSILVEVKPNKLKQAITNNLKKEAAEKFCKKNGYKYEMVEPKKMKDEQIADLYRKKKIKFLDRYEKKFKEKYLNKRG